MKLKSKSTTMFEIIDGDKSKYEFTAGRKYETTFKDFMESLGFSVIENTPAYKYTQYVTINGIKFDISYKFASYMGKNAFTGNTSPRKVRYVAIVLDRTSSIKIPVNKEINKMNFIAKMEGVLKERENMILSGENKEKLRNDTGNHIKNILLKDSFLNEHISCISCTSGIINISIDKYGTIAINASSEFHSFEPSGFPCRTIAEMLVLPNYVSDMNMIVLACIDRLKFNPLNLTPEQLNSVNSMYHTLIYKKQNQ